MVEAEASTVAAAATTTSEGAAEAAAAVSGAEAAAAAAVSGAAAEEDLDEGAVVEALINFKIKGLQNMSSCLESSCISVKMTSFVNVPQRETRYLTSMLLFI